MSPIPEASSIAQTQEKKEQDIDSEYKPLDQDQRENAARVLQRTYRGHRERRQQAGLSLDPSTRWTEAIKEAQYRELTRPRPRTSDFCREDKNERASEARQKWRTVGGIARRAGGDENDDEGQESSGDEGTRRRLDKQKRTQSTQMMDLSYFLEMVDINHRYGSNLRKYHAEWKRRDTHENFFYWLDHGDGKDLNLENCSRERLDAMKVRYLSREERLNYLTMVDGQGRLCWKKNGIRIDTSLKWKDSALGIVPVDDSTPSYSEKDAAAGAPANPSSGSDSAETSGDESAKAEKKTTEVPPDAILNRLVRKSSTKSKWIFVADTSFNLYVGIKQSGAFQHSSFLHGSRISSAGLIRIRDGKIKLLQPRSGHYRPPASNFLKFIHALRAKGVDMSATSVSASYAALVGIEGYMKGKSVVNEAKTGLKEMITSERKHETHETHAEGSHNEAHVQPTRDPERPAPEHQGAAGKLSHKVDEPQSKDHGKKHDGLAASLMRKLHIGNRKT